MLQFIRESLFCEHDKKMWSCLILVAFFGLLRVSEYTTNGNHSFDSSIHLCFNDVKFDPKEEQVCIDIKASKTDPFRVDSTIRLAKIEGDMCPVKSLKEYVKVRGIKGGPFFFLKHEHYVTRKYVVAFLQMALPRVKNINTQY